MATNPIGDNRTATVSMEPDLYAASKRFWGRGKRYRTFSAFVRELIREAVASDEAAVHKATFTGYRVSRLNEKKGKP